MRAPQAFDSPEQVFADELNEDPYPQFARLRTQRPVSRIGDTGVHLVATRDLIEEALGREADFSANITGTLIRGESGQPVALDFPGTAAMRVIATADEPEHRVHRALSQPRLAAPRVAELEGPLREWTIDVVAPWVAAGGGDFVPIAETVPARAVARILGLPDDDVRHHRAWAMMGGDMLAGDVSHERMATLSEETARMAAYLGEHLAAAMHEPETGPGAPLLHALGAGVKRGEIDADHAVGISTVMFGAGGESTAGLIASVMRLLAERPELADKLRADPALIPRAVEEVVRLESPFKFHYRAVRRDCTLGGFELRPGDRLMLLWGSANRDAAHFDAPDELRLDRRHPKDHLGFGRGAHFCIGAPLARLEARVVFEEVLARTRSVALRPDAPPVYARSLFVRRHEALPLEVSAAG